MRPVRCRKAETFDDAVLVLLLVVVVAICVWGWR
jgi:hypothetical protein